MARPSDAGERRERNPLSGQLSKGVSSGETAIIGLPEGARQPPPQASAGTPFPGEGGFRNEADADLRKRIADLGLTAESAIGFAPWIVDDPARRAQGLEQARREMELVSRIGGTRIAAPPAGAVHDEVLDLVAVARRYRSLLEAGAKVGVVPQLEVWGFARNLSRLSESTFVAMEAFHPDACLLLDVYHLYKGGSGFEGLRQLGPHAVQVMHMNDYPAIPRERIEDKDRVLPGEGVAPLGMILGILRDDGCAPALSIELFNEGYWKQHDAPALAALGLQKMKAATAAIG